MTTNLEEELSGLIRKLNDEALFVQSEKKHILDLYKQVDIFVFIVVCLFVCSE